MRVLILTVLAAVVLGGLPALAGEPLDLDPADVLTFDKLPQSVASAEIRVEDPLEPLAGSFALVSFAPMSSRRGARQALVTVKNTAAGARILDQRHLVATFADGFQALPRPFRERVDAGALFSTRLDFGTHAYPMIRVETGLGN